MPFSSEKFFSNYSLFWTFCYPDAVWSLLFLISLSFDSTFHIHFCYLNFNFQEHFLFLWMFLFWLCPILVSKLHDSEKNHDFFEVFFHLPALPLSLLGSLSQGVCRCLRVSPRGFPQTSGDCDCLFIFKIETFRAWLEVTVCVHTEVGEHSRYVCLCLVFERWRWSWFCFLPCGRYFQLGDQPETPFQVSFLQPESFHCHLLCD